MNIKEFLQREVNGSPTSERWHYLPFRLESVKPERLAEAFILTFSNRHYQRLREQRTALYNKVIELQDDPRSTPSRIRAALRAIKDKDKELALVILECLAVYSAEHGTSSLYTIDSLTEKYSSDEESKTHLQNISAIHRRMGFKIDSIENDVIDINNEMYRLDPTLKFNGAEVIRIALEQMRVFIGDTNSKLEYDEQKKLYADTADSISLSIDKRVKTFFKRIEEIKKKKMKQQK